MSERDNNKQNVDLNLNPDEIKLPEQEIVQLQDGTEIIRDQVEEEENSLPDITDKDLRKLIEFTTGRKDVSDEELASLREDEDELERMLRVSVAKSANFNYRPKKHFGLAYRKQRRKKNQQARKSRVINRV